MVIHRMLFLDSMTAVILANVAFHFVLFNFSLTFQQQAYAVSAGLRANLCKLNVCS